VSYLSSLETQSSINRGEISAGSSYSLPIAGAGTLGGVKINGGGLSIDGAGVLSATSGGMTWPGAAGIALYSGSSTWSTSITNNSANWNTAYGWGNHSGLYAPVAHVTNYSNPHAVSASQVGLGNVTNESKSTMFTSPTFTGVVTAAGITNYKGTSYNLALYSGVTNNNGILFDTVYGSSQRIITDYNGGGSEQALILGTWNNRTNQLFLATSGSIGIGNTSPDSKLDVTGDISIEGVGNHLYFDTTSVRQTASMYVDNDYWLNIFCNRGGTSKIILKNTPSISLETQGSPRMTITNTGVGVGRTDPTALLGVWYNTSNATAGPAFRVVKGSVSDYITNNTYDTVTIESNDVATLRIGEYDGTQTGICAGDGNTTITSTHGIRFYNYGTANANVYGGMGGTLRLNLTNTGATVTGTILATADVIAYST